MSVLDQLAEAVLDLARELDVDAIRFDWHIDGTDLSLGFDRDRPNELVLLIGDDYVSRWHSKEEP